MIIKADFITLKYFATNARIYFRTPYSVPRFSNLKPIFYLISVKRISAKEKFVHSWL